MSNKPMSRRDFLSGMFKTATAGMLASILKFVPEAQGAMAKHLPFTEGEMASAKLTEEQIQSVMTEAVGNAEYSQLTAFLEASGYNREARPPIGLEFRLTTKEKAVHHLDVLMTGYYNQNLDNGAVLAYARSNDTKLGKDVGHPIAVISQQQAYIVANGRVTVYEQPPQTLQSMIDIRMSKLSRGSRKRSKAVAYSPGCCTELWACFGSSFVCGILALCCGLGGACCPAAVAACAGAVPACAAAKACCDAYGCLYAC